MDKDVIPFRQSYLGDSKLHVLSTDLWLFLHQKIIILKKRDVKICIYGEICLILKCEKMSLYIGSIRM